jgi:hypothetical protein
VKRCSKPACARTGAVVLAYDYASRVVSLEDPAPGELSPHLYVMCIECSENLTPPRGWTIDDHRSDPQLFTPTLAGSNLGTFDT